MNTLCLATHDMNAFISFITEKFEQRSNVVTLNISVTNDIKVPVCHLSKRKNIWNCNRSWGQFE